jgi:hypothetical protein
MSPVKSQKATKSAVDDLIVERIARSKNGKDDAVDSTPATKPSSDPRTRELIRSANRLPLVLASSPSSGRISRAQGQSGFRAGMQLFSSVSRLGTFFCRFHILFFYFIIKKEKKKNAE